MYLASVHSNKLQHTLWTILHLQCTEASEKHRSLLLPVNMHLLCTLMGFCVSDFWNPHKID